MVQTRGDSIDFSIFHVLSNQSLILFHKKSADMAFL